LGEVTGSESVTISIAQMPAHQHTVAVNINSSEGGQNSPQNNYLGKTDPGIYATAHDNTQMGAQPPSGIQGGSQPTSIIQPILAVSFIIALEGIFPSRN
jgi:microcystin-dependent protein